MLRCLVAVAIAVLGGCTAAPAETPPWVEDGRYAMGTILEISLLPSPGARELLDTLYAEVARIEALASRHDAKSALSALNRGERSATADPDLVALLRHSQMWRRQSGGAFDISVGSWVELWIAAATRNRLPDAAERAHAASLTGTHAFHVDGAGRVTLRDGARLDLGAIAKGYALDRLVDRLRARDRSGPVALLNFGQSSYWALGAPPTAEVWTLVLRHPTRRGPAGTIGLRDQALSISAALGDSSLIEGRRYGHVIDPRTGEPLHREAQVAALAPDATQAEAISTAVLVLGRDEGLAWVETLPGSEALWIDAEGERATRGWATAARYRPTPEPAGGDPR